MPTTLVECPQQPCPIDEPGIGALGDDPNKIVQNVRLRRGLEGPQLILEWDAPKEIPIAATVRVVRKLYEFSTNPLDGIIVYEAPAGAGFVADLDLDPCKCYYYTIFTHETVPNVWHFSPRSQASELAIETGYFANRMFEMLPNIYILGDKLIDDANKDESVFPLFKEFDSEGHEYFNIHENADPEKEPKKRGPLSRFLKTIAIEPDIVKGLIDCMPTLWDVDETCCGNLPALGEIVGLDVNREFPCSKQRQEIKQQVAILKIKGTKLGIAARARLISGLRAEVKEWCGNILFSNTLDRTSLAYPNVGFGLKFKQFEDDTDYTPGNGITCFTFSIYFFLECDDCLPEQVVRKLNRILRKDFPVCRTGEFVFQDCKFVECYDHGKIVEKATDEECTTNVENFIPHCWLITNRLTDAPLPPPVLPPPTGPSTALPFEHHYTNSIHAITANPYRVCVERWWDEVEEAETYVEDLTDCVLIANRIERISNSKRWKTPCPDSTPAPCICYPHEAWWDEVQVGEFVEIASCVNLGLGFVSNRPFGGLSGNPPSLTNTLQSLVLPCGGDFWYDIVICASRVNLGRINCSRINEG